jgi:hypothetical protein
MRSPHAAVGCPDEHRDAQRQEGAEAVAGDLDAHGLRCFFQEKQLASDLARIIRQRDVHRNPLVFAFRDPFLRGIEPLVSQEVPDEPQVVRVDQDRERAQDAVQIAVGEHLEALGRAEREEVSPLA